ncbi:MAG: thiamine monophosphate kinase [Candidatus Bathyarchaeota archaeon BA1]|nr:MAG: thiamine monophosphate kinase [Candidatus Bathyarchaeota archaeon BA1]
MTQRSLSVGKLDPNLIKRLVFTCLGSPNPRVIIGPKIGEDATVIDFGDRVLVIHSDPITGAIENIGWLAVNVCANDIATRGVRPLWVLVVMLLPQSIDTTQLKRITSQIDEAAKELGIAIVGGHSEVTPGINRPILVATAVGDVEKHKFVSSSGAKIGDCVIVTKGAAIEGTAILSTELADTLQMKVDKKTIQGAQEFIRMISVVKDALTAIEVGGVHAMHDATEGGIAGGLQEIAWASNVGVIAYEDKIPIYEETGAICKAINIDPLKTIGSGALIISAHPEKAEKIVAALQKRGIQAAIIGKMVEKSQGSYVLRSDRTKLDLTKPIKEELWSALERHGISVGTY